MYGKIFASLYQGTLRGRAHEILVFTNMIACADKTGIVDKHPRAIAEDIGLDIEATKAAIASLEAPDEESRSREHDGARIIKAFDGRAWGWQIVNYIKYRTIRSEDDRRHQNRMAQDRWRKKSKPPSADVSQSKPPSADVSQSKPPSADVSRDKPRERERERQRDKEREKNKQHNATTARARDAEESETDLFDAPADQATPIPGHAPRQSFLDWVNQGHPRVQLAAESLTLWRLLWDLYEKTPSGEPIENRAELFDLMYSALIKTLEQPRHKVWPTAAQEWMMSAFPLPKAGA